MSLRLRLTLTYLALTALVLCVFGVVLHITMRESLQAEMDRRLAVRAAQAQLTIWPGTHSLTPGDLTSARLDLSPLADLDAPGVFVQVLNRRRDVVATSDTLRGATLPIHPESFDGALAGRKTFGDVVVEGGVDVRTLYVPIPFERDVVGVLEVGQSRQPLRATMQGLDTLLLLLGTAALAVAGCVGWLVAGRALGALSAISAQAAEIAARRDFSRRLPLVPAHDEVGQLARTIDGLLATVDETLRMHREFVADTSHELRNPLLAIRTNLEVLERLTDPRERAECRREAREQIERMSRLVDELLLLARVEVGQVIEPRRLALAPLLSSVAHTVQPRVHGQRLVVAPAAPLDVWGDERRLEQVLVNLLDNALRHTPPGGTVTLSLDREDGWARLRVADTGEGIPAKHLPHVFERFYRVDKARSRASGGTGLGLAIVKHLVEAHGGRIAVESSAGQGAHFTVWLPLCAEPPSPLFAELPTPQAVGNCTTGGNGVYP